MPGGGDRVARSAGLIWRRRLCRVHRAVRFWPRISLPARNLQGILQIVSRPPAGCVTASMRQGNAGRAEQGICPPSDYRMGMARCSAALTLLLLDATGAYHRLLTQERGTVQGRIVTPLMRLQDPDYTKVILVALPETTPVSEAASLQDDLRRARIEPWGWVVNRSLARAGTTDHLLQRRIMGEAAQIARIRNGLARRMYLLPFLTEPPVGVPALLSLT